MDRKTPRPPTIVVSVWEEGPGAIPKRRSTTQPTVNPYALPCNARPLASSSASSTTTTSTSSTSCATSVEFISVDTGQNEEQNVTTMADLTYEKDPEESTGPLPPPAFDLNFSLWSLKKTPQLRKNQSLPESSSFAYEMPVTEFTGKIRKKKSRLHCRRKAVAYLKSPIGHDIQGEKRLRQAVQQGNQDEVQNILQEGTNPNRADDKGRAAIHFGVTKGHRGIVQLLLDGGSDVNLKDSVGNTPLHLACIGSQIEMVVVLLEAGANCHELDGSGHTPIHLAKSRLHHLRGSLSEDSRREVFKLLGMLRVYMTCTGRPEHISKLDSVSEKLQANHSQKEMDEVQSILECFTKMNL